MLPRVPSNEDDGDGHTPDYTRRSAVQKRKILKESQPHTEITKRKIDISMRCTLSESNGEEIE
jgi:hypothetical protein